MSGTATRTRSRTPLKERRVVVYHGTDASFDRFDPRFLGSANGRAPVNMTGFNFTDDPEVAATFGRRVIEAEISFSDPFVVDARGADYGSFKHALNDAVTKASVRGHDCVIVRDYRDAGTRCDDLDVVAPSTHYVPHDVGRIRVVGEEIVPDTMAPVPR